MRSSSLTTLGLLAMVAAAASAYTSGCSVDCHDNLRCGEASPILSGSGGGGDGGGGAGGGGSSCVPAVLNEPVDDACGVFVSTKGDDSAAGSKDAPLATLAKAIEVAGKRPVYVCAQDFNGAVVIPAGTVIYGGLGCEIDSAWAYIGSQFKTHITANPGEIPVTFASGAGMTQLADIKIVAANAEAPGGSSIAAVADHATVELVRCDLEAGNAAAGESGKSYEDPATPGGDGNSGKDACSGSQVLGGADVTNLCDTGKSVGGSGGLGAASSATSGNVGTPAGAMNIGGAAELAASVCGNGGNGDLGMPGGPGAGGNGLGSLNVAGYIGVPGQPGIPGQIGQGGGGGGGSKGGSGAMKCADAAKAGGAGGGSGGAGGCGGAGGRGGGAGGSSIGLVRLGGQVTFSSGSIPSLIKTGNAGGGGNGGAGQGGGPGGKPGSGGSNTTATALKPGCAGGSGGAGGPGGPGGGGAGGHSIGIAFTGSQPDVTTIQFQIGSPGDPGSTDPGAASATTGKKADVLKFPE